MRLTDLNPEWTRIYRDRDQTADRGGFPTDTFALTFSCPTCGPQYRISINVGPTRLDGPPRRWAVSPSPDELGWIERATITPSINHTESGHGRKHPGCSFHGHITNGEIRAPGVA